jgi:hypothetical protein
VRRGLRLDRRWHRAASIGGGEKLRAAIGHGFSLSGATDGRSDRPDQSLPATNSHPRAFDVSRYVRYGKHSDPPPSEGLPGLTAESGSNQSRRGCAGALRGHALRACGLAAGPFAHPGEVRSLALHRSGLVSAVVGLGGSRHSQRSERITDGLVSSLQSKTTPRLSSWAGATCGRFTRRDQGQVTSRSRPPPPWDRTPRTATDGPPRR